MTPAEYLRLVVLPTIAEYMDDPVNQRRAYLACIAAAHLGDYVSRVTQIGRRKVRERVVESSAYVACCLEVVEGIGNGTKHAGPSREAAFPFAPGYEQYVPGFAFDTPGAGLDEGRWDRPGLAVAHRIANGAEGSTSYCIDDCLCVVVRSYTKAFPDLFQGIDLAAIAPELDRTAWLTALISAPIEPDA